MIAKDGRGGAQQRADGQITIDVDIYSDLLCPYSYMIRFVLEGVQRQYQKAHPGVKVDLLWRPHCVIPPLERRVDKLQMYQHFDRLNPGMLNRVHATAAKLGASLALSGFTGSSRAAHRLIYLTLRVAGPERQAEVVAALYRGHFAEGKDISDEKWLLRVGLRAGLSRKLVTSILRDTTILDDDDASSIASSSSASSASSSSTFDDHEGRERSKRGSGTAHSHGKEVHIKREEDYEEEDDEVNRQGPAEDEEDQEDGDEDEDEDEDGEYDFDDDDEDVFERDVPSSIKGEAVPCVIIQGRYKVGGLQSPEVYEGVFDKVRALSRP